MNCLASHCSQNAVILIRIIKAPIFMITSIKPDGDPGKIWSSSIVDVMCSISSSEADFPFLHFRICRRKLSTAECTLSHDMTLVSVMAITDRRAD